MTVSRTTLALFSILGSCLPALAAQQPVLVVDDTPGPGVQFTQLQAALDAAGPDSIVLVKPGEYSAAGAQNFLITGAKHVVAETPGTVTLHSRLLVVATAAHERVYVRGIRVANISPNSGPTTLDVYACAGTVWFEDVVVDAPLQMSLPLSLPTGLYPQAVRVESSRAVFTNCTVNGLGLFAFALGGQDPLDFTHCVLWMQNSEVDLHGCSVLPYPAASYPAFLLELPGIWMQNSTLRAWDTQVRGTPGKPATSFLGATFCPTSGGPGVLLAAGASNTAEFVDCDVQGGPGGSIGTFTTCAPAPAGVPAQTIQGTATFAPGTARTLASTALTHGGTAQALQLAGAPGELAVLGVSAAAQPLPLRDLHAVVWIGAPTLLFVAGTTDAAGALSFGYTSPTPAAGTQGLRLLVQAAFAGAGSVALSNATLLSCVIPGL